ncbi:hypothetical protein V498_08184, partial [Pseudogymnoascus sp. VKM F-4517 (FW-2822)]
LKQAAGQSKKCTIDSIDSCVNPIASGFASFEFKPLFTTNSTFVYAFDVEYEAEIENKTITPGSSLQTDAKVAFWLEYTETQLTPSDHQETYMAVLLNGNITGTPSGAHNGCDGVWGPECSKNLGSFLKSTITKARSRSFADLPSVLSDVGSPYLNKSDPETAKAIANLSCPQGLFDETYLVSGAGGSFNEAGKLAKENGDDTRIMPSGNASDPYISKRIGDTTYDEQIDQVAVALIARIPLEGDLYQNVDNIQLEMVCVKAKRLDGPDESNRSNGSGGSESQPDNAARPVFGMGGMNGPVMGALTK